MEKSPSISCVIHKIVVFSVLGFLIITLGPVVLGVAVAVLPFALVGVAAWVALQVTRHGPNAVAQPFHEIGGKLQATAARVGAVPGRVAAAVGEAARATTRRLATVGRALASFLSPVLGGAALGGFLGAAGGFNYHDLAIRLPLGIGAGALIGLAAAWQWRRPVYEAIVVDDPAKAVHA